MAEIDILAEELSQAQVKLFGASRLLGGIVQCNTFTTKKSTNRVRLKSDNDKSPKAEKRSGATSEENIRDATNRRNVHLAANSFDDVGSSPRLARKLPCLPPPWIDHDPAICPCYPCRQPLLISTVISYFGFTAVSMHMSRDKIGAEAYFSIAEMAADTALQRADSFPDVFTERSRLELVLRVLNMLQWMFETQGRDRDDDGCGVTIERQREILKKYVKPHKGFSMTTAKHFILKFLKQCTSLERMKREMDALREEERLVAEGRTNTEAKTTDQDSPKPSRSRKTRNLLSVPDSEAAVKTPTMERSTSRRRIDDEQNAAAPRKGTMRTRRK